MLFISGISTSGKRELGERISKELNAVLIDQKDYFLKNKEIVKLSNEKKVINYDSINSIDWDNFNLKLLSLSLSEVKTVVIGFALIPDLIKVSPELSIYLNYKVSDKLLVDIISSRRNKDRNEVEELVIPFHKSIDKYENSIILDIY